MPIHLTRLSEVDSPVQLPRLGDLRSLGREWVPLGADDGFYELLYNLSHSPTHAAVLSKKRLFVYGGGLADASPLLEFSADPSRLLRHVVSDYVLYGTYVLLVRLTPTRVGDAVRYEVDLVEPLSPRQVRKGRPDETMRVDRLFYSYDYTRLSDYPVVEYPAFSADLVGTPCEVDAPDIHAIYYYDGNIKFPDIYAMPDYVGALVDIKTDALASQFRHKAIKNGFAVIATLKIPNPELTAEDRLRVEAEFMARYAGTGGESLMFLYGVPGAQGSVEYPELVYQPLPDVSKTYAELAKDCWLKILMAHGVTPSLVGFSETGAIASEGDALAKAVATFEITYARSARHEVLSWLDVVLPDVPKPVLQPIDLSSLS